MGADALRPMTEQERMKYEAATELGLIDRLLKVGWGGLTAGEASAGVGMDKVVKTTVFLRDMNDFAAMNGVYATFFDAANLPARSAVQVARLPKDAGVEIEAIAYLG